MRGEHRDGIVPVLAHEGSSPHARGTLMIGASVAVVGGIIPACAGNTLTTKAVIMGGRDHPRMRGEHLKEVARRV